MAEKTRNKETNYVASDKELALVEKVMTRYRAAYSKKEDLGMNELWKTCHDYWSGEVNLPEDDNDPGSEVNIVQPIIESQVADIVNGDIDIMVKGLGPSDQLFARETTQILRWVWHHNNMMVKLDGAERDRLNLGNTVWKVYWDRDQMGGRGLPIMQPMSPDCFFPDPKVTDLDFLEDADFIIQTSWYSRRKLVQLFGEKAKFVKPESGGNYDSRIFGEDQTASGDEVVGDQACLYEYWEKDDDGKLRLIYCTKDMILADSADDDEEARIPEIRRYPFILIVGYKRKGRLWGMGDTEQLIPVQDIINDLDDQIRLNARQMGNAQTVVGIGSGININKWTNAPGLKIPAKDHTAYSVVQPPYIPGYINARREKAFYESELVSGRSEVVEGRRSGSLRAASAILALQEAGSRRVNHKKLMLQEGMRAVVYLVLDYIKEFMTIEQSFDIVEKDKTDYLWFRASQLKEIPQLTLNENFNAESDNVELHGRYKQLYDVDEEGNTTEPMTKDAEFDLEVHLGAGMPNNKSFVYEATVELHRENIITTEETREVLKQLLNWPIINPWEPEGTFSGRNSSPEQLAIANTMTGASMPQQQPAPQPTPAPVSVPPVASATPQVDPVVIQRIQAMIASGNINPQELYTLLQQLPPEVVSQIMASLQGGM